MVAAYWAFAALALALGIWLDHRRNFACKNKPAEVALASTKHRNALYVVLIVFILVGYIMQSGGFNANAFGPMQGFNLMEKGDFRREAYHQKIGAAVRAGLSVVCLFCGV